MSNEGKAIRAAHVIIQGGHVTDLRCLIDRCPHTFFYKCIIYNSAVLQQYDVLMCCITSMKMKGGIFFHVLRCCRRWCEGATWPCTSVITDICIFMFLLNGLRQFSQQIPWQTAYFGPVARLRGFFSLLRAAHQHLTICYFCLGGIARTTPRI